MAHTITEAIGTQSVPLSASASSGPRLSPMAVGLGVMAVAIVAVMAVTTALILVMTDVSFLAAIGFGLYCAFWLGIGFGTIFGSAAVFGRDH